MILETVSTVQNSPVCVQHNVELCLVHMVDCPIKKCMVETQQTIQGKGALKCQCFEQSAHRLHY